MGTPGQVAPGWSARGSVEVAPSPARGPLLSGRAEVGHRGWPHGRVSRPRTTALAGPGEGGSRDAGSGKGKKPGVLGESQKFLFQAYRLILREKGVHHGGCE